MKRIASLALAMGLMVGCEPGTTAPVTPGGAQVSPADAAGAADEANRDAKDISGETAKEAAAKLEADAAAKPEADPAAKPNP